MKKLWFILTPLAVVVIFAGSGAMAQTKDAPPAGNAVNGKKLWVTDGCYSCHGFDGHGGAGAKLAPRPIATVAFIAYVRHPAPGGMPTFSEKVISNADLTDMWAYLKSIPDPPAVKDIPLLNQ
jgi:mono/diheme cytochrome c family protein